MNKGFVYELAKTLDDDEIIMSEYCKRLDVISCAAFYSILCDLDNSNVFNLEESNCFKSCCALYKIEEETVINHLIECECLINFNSLPTFIFNGYHTPMYLVNPLYGYKGFPGKIVKEFLYTTNYILDVLKKEKLYNIDCYYGYIDYKYFIDNADYLKKEYDLVEVRK